MTPTARSLAEHIGAKVRLLRSRRGWSQTHLAAKVGLSRCSITNLEAGRQRLPLTRFLALARALDVDPGLLLPADKPWRSGR